MPSASQRKLVWLIGQIFKQNKRSYTLAAFLVVALIALCCKNTSELKGNPFFVLIYANLKYLNDLEANF